MITKRNKLRYLLVAVAVAVTAFLCGIFMMSGGALKANADTDLGDGWFGVQGVESAGGTNLGEITGVYCLGTNTKIYNSIKPVWANRFGVNFLGVKESGYAQGDIEIIISADGSKWYTNTSNNGYFRIVFKNVVYNYNFETTNTSFDVYAGSTKVYSGSTGTGNVIWVPDYKSTSMRNMYSNNVSMGKLKDGNWGLNIGGISHKIDSKHTTTLNNELAKFDKSSDGSGDYVGYLQWQWTGKFRMVFQTISYGLASSAIMLPENWGDAGVFNQVPPLIETFDNEKVGFFCQGSPFAITSRTKLPLAGFDIKFLMAHGKMQNMSVFTMAFCSNYLDGWYTATYSIVLKIIWAPDLVQHGVTEDKAVINMYYFQPNFYEDSVGDDIGKCFSKTFDFNWGGLNELQITKKRGKWAMILNGEDMYGDSTLSDNGSNKVKGIFGKDGTFDDIAKKVAQYVPAAGGVLNLFNGEPTGEAFILTDWVASGSANSAFTLNYKNMKAINYKTTAVGTTLNVNLSTIFNYNGTASLTYSATKGNVSGSTWTYTAKIDESIVVTFKVTNGVEYFKTRMMFTFVENRGANYTYNSSGGGGAVVFTSEDGREIASITSNSMARAGTSGSGCKTVFGADSLIIAVTLCVIAAAVTFVRIKSKKR